jgi:hypothetical protein
MKGVQGHFHNLTALIKLQMAPHNEQSMEAITNKDFFTNISRDGYPSSNKTQAQPWKKVWNGTQGRNVQADGKMVVACASLRHDYGMQRPCLYLQTSANPHRLLWSWRLLVVPINLSGCGAIYITFDHLSNEPGHQESLSAALDSSQYVVFRPRL